MAITGPYRGFKIMGNGQFCAVYADHQNKAGAIGLQHLYYGDYTVDYAQATTISIERTATQPIVFEQTLTDPYFAAQSTAKNTRFRLTLHVFPLLEQHALVYRLKLKNISASVQNFKPEVHLKTQADPLPNVIDDHAGPELLNFGSMVMLTGFRQPLARTQGPYKSGEERILDWLLVMADNEAGARAEFDSLQTAPDLLALAKKQWDRWLQTGTAPDFGDPKISDFYKANLTAVKAATLNGDVPADMTGQFVTNGLPQLYPRDALMTARCFLETGHYPEAKAIINRWNSIPYKTTGEWYARYDARGQAVDGGSGARYDVPEWDSNGYYATLIRRYHDLTGEWVGDELRLWELLDFIAPHLNENSLLREGGIIEWVGDLPATNMNVYAGLLDGAIIAQGKGDSARAQRYLQTAEKIAANLYLLYDPKMNTFFDFRDGKYSYNTSANFGYAWGCRRPEILDWLRNSNLYYNDHAVKLNGGMQYFDADGYGHDLFGFTTAAAAQFQAYEGDEKSYRRHLNWLMDHANIYGLMPERIYYPPKDERDGVAEASPLTWCSAEFVLALLAGAEASLFGTAEFAESRLMQYYQRMMSPNGLAVSIPSHKPLRYTTLWMACIDVLAGEDALQKQLVADVERISRNLARRALNVNVRTSLKTKKISREKSLLYGVEVENNGRDDVVGMWRQRPFFAPEEPLWGMPQGVVTQDEIIIHSGETRVFEIEIQRLLADTGLAWRQRAGLEFLLYVSPRHALVYPAWLYLSQDP